MGRYTGRPQGDYTRYTPACPCPFLFPLHLTTAGFLVYFEGEILRRAHKNFSFVNGRYVCSILSPSRHTSWLTYFTITLS